MIFVTEKDVICKKKILKKKNLFFFTKKDVICTRKRRYNNGKLRYNNVVTYG